MGGAATPRPWPPARERPWPRPTPWRATAASAGHGGLVPPRRGLLQGSAFGNDGGGADATATVEYTGPEDVTAIAQAVAGLGIVSEAATAQASATASGDGALGVTAAAASVRRARWAGFGP